MIYAKKKLIINDSELNGNNSNITCHESEEDYINKELTYNFSSESNVLSNSSIDIEDIISYNLEIE